MQLTRFRIIQENRLKYTTTLLTMLCSCSVPIDVYHQQQRFSCRTMVNFPLLFWFRFPVNETGVFNFIYLNGTGVQMLISTKRQDCPLCVFFFMI